MGPRPALKAVSAFGGIRTTKSGRRLVNQSGESLKLDRTIHVLNRLAFGPRPGDVEHVRAIGPDAYVHEQMNPASIPIPDDLVERVRGYRTLHMTPIALFVEYERPINQARRNAKANG